MEIQKKIWFLNFENKKAVTEKKFFSEISRDNYLKENLFYTNNIASVKVLCFNVEAKGDRMINQIENKLNLEFRETKNYKTEKIDYEVLIYSDNDKPETFNILKKKLNEVINKIKEVFNRYIDVNKIKVYFIKVAEGGKFEDLICLFLDKKILNKYRNKDKINSDKLLVEAKINIDEVKSKTNKIFGKILKNKENSLKNYVSNSLIYHCDSNHKEDEKCFGCIFNKR